MIGRDLRELHRGRSLCREYSGTVKPENNHKQKVEDQLSVPTQGLRLQAIFLIQGEAGGISSNSFVRIQADVYIAIIISTKNISSDLNQMFNLDKF